MAKKSAKPAKGEFAKNLAQFFIVSRKPEHPVRLNKRMKAILIEMMQNSLENTSIMFDDDQERAYHQFMDAMLWLKCKLNRNELPKVKLDARIGWTIMCWIWDNQNYHRDDEPDFDKAIEWVTTKITTKYSHNQLAQSTWGK